MFAQYHHTLFISGTGSIICKKLVLKKNNKPKGTGQTRGFIFSNSFFFFILIVIKESCNLIRLEQLLVNNTKVDVIHEENILLLT